jgi:transposase
VSKNAAFGRIFRYNNRMNFQSKTLPDDPTALKQMLVDLQMQLETEKRLNQTLTLRLQALLRQRFGRSSEKQQDNAQLDLLIEDTETAIAATDLPSTDKPASRAVTRARQPLPAHLPRTVKQQAPASCDCPDCGKAMKAIGEDVSELLDVVPAQYRVIKLVRPKYSCKACERIVQAPAQERVIDKGMASSALIAQVIVDKYADHLPLYRQAERFKREGIDLDRSTLAGWVGRAGVLLQPLVEAIRRHVMAGHKLHADDTTAPTLKPGNGKTLTGRYWNYVRDDRPWQSEVPPAVWFQYSTSRSGQEPLKHLEGFNGVIQADAYAGYNLAVQRGISRAGCWAHVRRKFYDIAEATDSPVAREAIKRIEALYRIERRINGRPPDERRQIRQQQAVPLMETFKVWLDARLRECAKGSGLGKAINYARKQWNSLVLYLEDGCVEIDNNAAERAIRPLALGRKNHLFAGSEDGGHYGAALYSIMGTARLNGIDPKAYLTAVLKRINNTPINQVEQLLPWNIDLDLSAVNEAV